MHISNETNNPLYSSFALVLCQTTTACPVDVSSAHGIARSDCKTEPLQLLADTEKLFLYPSYHMMMPFACNFQDYPDTSFTKTPCPSRYIFGAESIPP